MRRTKPGTPSTPKRHHVVAQFHLERFRPGAAGLLWVFDKPQGAFKQLGTGDVAVIGRYYSVATQGQPVEVLEALLAELEGRAKPVVEQLTSLPYGSFVLTNEDRWALALYVATLRVRSPTNRTILEEFASEIGQQAAIAEFRSSPTGAVESGSAMETIFGNQPSVSIESVIGALEQGRVRLQAPKQISLFGIPSGFRLAPMLFRMRWTVYKRRVLPHFILGDSPVVLEAPDGEYRSRSQRFADKDAWFAVPLDPQYALVGTNFGPDCVVVDGDDDHTLAVIGQSQWQHAHRQVIGRMRQDLDAIYEQLPPHVRHRASRGRLLENALPTMSELLADSKN